MIDFFGLFAVNCDAGFEMNDDERCRGKWSEFSSSIRRLFLIDINECVSNPCPKTMKCENTPGSFRCIEGCDEGYTWSMKHRQCRGKFKLGWDFDLMDLFRVDLDECAVHKHNCTFGHRCENMPGSFR